MKSTGIVRKVDELGRIVLPIELRRTLDIAVRDEIEIYLDDDKVILKKYEPSLEELLMMPMRHIQNVKDCLEACTSKRDVLRVLELTPNMFGEWTIEFYDEYRIFTVINTYFDDDEGELKEEYCYDYPEDWEKEEE